MVLQPDVQRFLHKNITAGKRGIRRLLPCIIQKQAGVKRRILPGLAVAVAERHPGTAGRILNQRHGRAAGNRIIYAVEAGAGSTDCHNAVCFGALCHEVAVFTIIIINDRRVGGFGTVGQLIGKRKVPPTHNRHRVAVKNRHKAVRLQTDRGFRGNTQHAVGIIARSHGHNGIVRNIILRFSGRHKPAERLQKVFFGGRRIQRLEVLPVNRIRRSRRTSRFTCGKCHDPENRNCGNYHQQCKQ